VDKLAPWGDWQRLDPIAFPYFLGLGGWGSIPTANVRGDQITQMQAQVPGVTATQIGLGHAKPTFSRATLAASFAYGFQIPIPDFVLDTQRFRAVDWSGDAADPMAEKGGLRAALLIEQVFSSFAEMGITIGADLTLFLAAISFRGYGASEGALGTLPLASDGAIAASTIFSVATAFPRMQLPTDQSFVVDPDPAPAPTFAPRGIMRIQTLVELPNTLTPGDYAECVFQLATEGQEGGVDVQFQHFKYRWIAPPYPFLPNQCVQLTGDQGQPRTDRSQFTP
jgi:hypothetical protein